MMLSQVPRKRFEHEQKKTEDEDIQVSGNAVARDTGSLAFASVEKKTAHTMRLARKVSSKTVNIVKKGDSIRSIRNNRKNKEGTVEERLSRVLAIAGGRQKKGAYFVIGIVGVLFVVISFFVIFFMYS